MPLVKRKDEAKYGEYRTKRVILEVYDDMKDVMKNRGEYQMWLDPSPADEGVANETAEATQ